MTEPNAMAAELLEASASGYAAAVASSVLEDEAIRSRFGPGGMASWKAHFVQRLLELAAAVRVGEPELFAARVVWQKKAFLAQEESNPDDLRQGIVTMKAVLSVELPENLSQVVGPYLDGALAALDAEYAPDPSELDPSDATAALTLKYLAACLEGDPRRAIELVLDAAREGMPMRTIYAGVLLPAQREIGRMWHTAEAGIAEERVVSDTTRRLMALLTHEQTPVAATGRTVLAAAVASNAHDIGIRAVADLFEAAGWRVICLGADVPSTEIATAARFFDVDLVVLATTLTTQLKQLQATIDAIRSSRGDEAKILVGGHVFADAPELWKSLGADGYAPDAGAAVETGGDLVGLPVDG